MFVFFQLSGENKQVQQPVSPRRAVKEAELDPHVDPCF